MEICGPEMPRQLFMGLVLSRASGEEAVNSIVAARKDGAFIDLYDFCNRVDIKKWVNAH